MRRIATGVLSFTSGNRVTVKDGRWRRIQGWKLKKSCLIVFTAAHLAIKFKLVNRCRSYAAITGKKLAYLKPHDYV